MARVLIVDDDPDVSELIALALEGQGHDIDSVESGRAALERLAQHAYDLIVCDLHMLLLSHFAKYRSLMPSLALIFQLIDAVDTGTRGPVARAAAERATAWCTYLAAHARRLYAMLTDAARVAAAVLATKITHGRLPSPFTARD